MAQAYECDRCKILFPITYISKFRISRWSPSMGGVNIDLCPNCTKELDKFFEMDSARDESKDDSK